MILVTSSELARRTKAVLDAVDNGGQVVIERRGRFYEIIPGCKERIDLETLDMALTRQELEKK